MPGASRASSRTNPIIWILAGIGGFLLLIFLGIVSTGAFIAHQFTQNPTLAAAKLLTAGDPKIEVLSADKDRNTVTFRNRDTNDVVTMNFDDIKNGKLVVKSNGKETSILTHDNGQNGTLEINSPQGTVKIGGGSDAKVPDWVPVYPGTTPQVTLAVQGTSADGGTFQFKTNDSPVDVLSFYEKSLKQAGFKITANVSGNLTGSSGAMLTAEEPDSKRNVMVSAGMDGSSATVNVIFGKHKT